MFYKQAAQVELDPLFYSPIQRNYYHQRMGEMNTIEIIDEENDSTMTVMDDVEQSLEEQEMLFGAVSDELTRANKSKLISIGERLMRLLEQLDQLQIKSIQERSSRKGLVRQIQALLDRVDSNLGKY